MAPQLIRRLRRSSLRHIRDAKLRDGVFEMFEETRRLIDEDGVDLVILCARRLACLYQVLVRNGDDPLEGALVVSDRFLDSADMGEEWKWRNVVILDDSVVLGTTLAALYDQVRARTEALEGAKVRCSAVCVDKEKKAQYLLDRIEFSGAREVSSEDVERFSKDVVTTLFRAGVPFFSDFPVTVPVNVDREGLRDFLASDLWHVADVTAPVISSDAQGAYVQIPKAHTTQAILSRMAPEVAALVEAFKLRSYVSREPVPGKQPSVTFVPIAMLRPCYGHELDSALSAISTSLAMPDLKEIDWLGVDNAAKHRLVQMYASACVLYIATSDLLDGLLGDGSWLDQTALGLYFGSRRAAVDRVAAQVRELVAGTPAGAFPAPVRTTANRPTRSELLDDDDLRALLWEQRELLAGVRGDAVPDVGQMTKVGIVAAHAISSIFGYVSEQFEAPQQQDIRDLGSYEAYSKQYLNNPRRRVLNQTLTMSELANAILGEVGAVSGWDRALVSLGVDIGNDLGIVVPSTQEDPVQSLVYRAYRLGETAQLAHKPLSRWSPSDGGADALDEFVRAASSGYPLISTNVTISLPEWTLPEWRITKRRASAKRSWLTELTKMREDALPGLVVGRYDGVVTAVSEDAGVFEAEVTDVITLDITLAELGMNQVGEHRDRLRPGATFEWTVFEKPFPDHVDRTSRVRLLPRPPLDDEAIEQSMNEFAFLAGTE